MGRSSKHPRDHYKESADERTSSTSSIRRASVRCPAPTPIRAESYGVIRSIIRAKGMVSRT
jgi:hypothetical protein